MNDERWLETGGQAEKTGISTFHNTHMAATTEETEEDAIIDLHSAIRAIERFDAPSETVRANLVKAGDRLRRILKG